MIPSCPMVSNRELADLWESWVNGLAGVFQPGGTFEYQRPGSRFPRRLTITPQRLNRLMRFGSKLRGAISRCRSCIPTGCGGGSERNVVGGQRLRSLVDDDAPLIRSTG
jgi:hypothetical protein